VSVLLGLVFCSAVATAVLDDTFDFDAFRKHIEDEGLDTVDDWSMNFRSHRYGFMAPAGSSPLAGWGIGRPLLKANADLAAHQAAASSIRFSGACVLLRDKSLKQF